MARERRGVGRGPRRGEPYADISGDGAPIDIAAVRRDDALIDAIAGDGPVATDDVDEYRLAVLLAGWRADIVGPALPAAPDLDTVAALVDQELAAQRARRRVGGRLRLVRPIAGAAALVALTMGVMTAFSYNAEPGDPLWKVKEVVFSDRADSTVAQVDTRTDLEQADHLIASGNAPEAKMYLDRAGQRVTDVGDTGQRDELLARWNELMNKVTTLTKNPPPVPAAPLPTTADAATTVAEPDTSAMLVPSTPGSSETTSTVQTIPGLPGVTIPSLPVTIPSLPVVIPGLPGGPTVDPRSALVPAPSSTTAAEPMPPSTATTTTTETAPAVLQLPQIELPPIQLPQPR